MKMKRSNKVEILIVVFVLVVPVGGWLLSEIRWARINNPDGKFTTVHDYLAQRRRPARVTKAQKGGNTFFIAYSPMDTWLAVPSGPAAYVFDETGHMVEWSRDTGHDWGFQQKWPLPQSESSVEELKRVGFQKASRTSTSEASDDLTGNTQE